MVTKDLGALRNSNPNPITLTQYNAVTDQYLLEGGAAHPFKKVRGLAVLFGPRMEGVPARNLLPVGDNLGFRRPGFAISVEPGVQYVRNGQMFSFTIARAIYRDRTVSVPDSLTGGHGDAAFANWVWLATYTFRTKRPMMHRLTRTRMPPRNRRRRPRQEFNTSANPTRAHHLAGARRRTYADPKQQIIRRQK